MLPNQISECVCTRACVRACIISCYLLIFTRVRNVNEINFNVIQLVICYRIGASIVGRLASWLGTISISLQGALGMVYIGEILLKSVPFTRCEVCSNLF